MGAIAELKAVLGLDTTPFKRGMDGAKSQAKGFASDFKSTMSTIGGALGVGVGVGTFVALGKQAIEAGFQIERMAKLTGLASDQYQALADAVEDSGGDASALGQAFLRIRDAQGQVVNGNKAVIESLRRAGIEASVFSRAGAAQAFEMIARAGRNAGWEGEAFTGIADVLSIRSLPQLRAALDEVADKGLGGLTDAFRKSGEYIPAKQLAEARLELKRLEDQSVAFAGKFVAAMRNGLEWWTSPRTWKPLEEQLADGMNPVEAITDPKERARLRQKMEDDAKAERQKQEATDRANEQATADKDLAAADRELDAAREKQITTAEKLRLSEERLADAKRAVADADKRNADSPEMTRLEAERRHAEAEVLMAEAELRRAEERGLSPEQVVARRREEVAGAQQAAQNEPWDRALQSALRSAQDRLREAQQAAAEADAKRDVPNDSDAAMMGTLDDLARLKKNDARIADLEAGGTPERGIGGVTADSYARMGGLVGGATRVGLDQQIERLREIRDLMQANNEILEQLAGG